MHAELKEFKSKHPREFWKKIARVTGKRESNEIPIPTDELGMYFESLLAGPVAKTYAEPPHDLETNTVLDEPIEEEEVRAAISSLKKK